MYHPVTVLDGMIETGWLESKEGPGIGEYLKMKLNKEITVDEIRIAPGYFDPQWWKANHRIKTLEITIYSKTYRCDFKDTMEMQKVDFPSNVTFREITFTILDVFQSSVYNDAGVSEIRFFNNGKEVPVYADWKSTY